MAYLQPIWAKAITAEDTHTTAMIRGHVFRVILLGYSKGVTEKRGNVVRTGSFLCTSTIVDNYFLDVLGNLYFAHAILISSYINKHPLHQPRIARRSVSLRSCFYGTTLVESARKFYMFLVGAFEEKCPTLTMVVF